MNGLGKLLLLLVILLVGPVLALAGGTVRLGQDWRTADRSSAGIAPAPADAPEAIVQVWAARAFNWRGLFAVHTWIATKPGNAPHYTVHQVIGWRGRGGGNVVVSSPDFPDRSWYGHPPRLVKELRGPGAASAIPKILEAVDAYPYTHHYRLWPGPNSNTFTAFVVRRVPELGAELPVIAIGKDYLEGGRLFAAAPADGDSRSRCSGSRGSSPASKKASRSTCSDWSSASTRWGRRSSFRRSGESGSEDRGHERRPVSRRRSPDAQEEGNRSRIRRNRSVRSLHGEGREPAPAACRRRKRRLAPVSPVQARPAPARTRIRSERPR